MTLLGDYPAKQAQCCLQGMPLQCSVFLTRHADILKQTNASGAAYLFQPDKLNAEYDLGDKTIQCGRRPDAFKLWLAWKVKHRTSLTRMTVALLRLPGAA